MFDVNTEVTIGTLKAEGGISYLRIKRSLHNIADTAIIRVPDVSCIEKGKRSSVKEIPTGDLFNDGDPVEIKIGYNDDLRQEFKGFVRRRNMGDTMEIECEGYVRKLRQDVNVTHFYPKTSVKELLQLVTNGTGITVHVADDIPLYNMQLSHANGEDIVREIKKVTYGAVNVFFVSPTVLWAGLTYTPVSKSGDPFSLGTVNLRLGYNTPENNALKERVVEGEPVQININCVLPNGSKIQTASEATYAKNKVKAVINNIRDSEALTRIANEAQYKRNYTGYEGKVMAFLQPYCLPGYVANTIDDRYPERNGKYLIESTEVVFDMNGAFRNIELGPLLGFKTA